MIKGIIFDMDGVISDTQKLHSQVETELLTRYGIEITPQEITRRYSGVRTQEFFKDLLDQQKKDYKLDALMQEKWSRMKTLASESVDEVPGSVELIKKLFAQGVPLAVASASNLSYVRQVLKTLGVFEYFKAVISGDMVLKGKPDPESFLLAAEEIDVSPEECLVIEDGRSGMVAARQAGMYCIGLVKEKKEDYPTKNLILELHEITSEFLEKLEK